MAFLCISSRASPKAIALPSCFYPAFARRLIVECPSRIVPTSQVPTQHAQTLEALSGHSPPLTPPIAIGSLRVQPDGTLMTTLLLGQFSTDSQSILVALVV